METICWIPEPVCACVSEKCLLVPRLYTTPFLPSIFPRLPLHILTGGGGGGGVEPKLYDYFLRLNCETLR